MREVAVDSNVFLAAWLGHEPHHAEAVRLMQDLRSGDCAFHISNLVPVEICSSIVRKTKSSVRAYLAQREIRNWVDERHIKLYPLNERRMNKAQQIALRDKLRGADAVIAEVAEELRVPLVTFDEEISRRFSGR